MPSKPPRPIDFIKSPAGDFPSSFFSSSFSITGSGNKFYKGSCHVNGNITNKEDHSYDVDSTRVFENSPPSCIVKGRSSLFRAIKCSVLLLDESAKQTLEMEKPYHSKSVAI